MPPEQGGTRFGPFVGVISVGTDASRCQVSVAAMPGLQPVHASVADRQHGHFTVSPGSRECVLYLVRAGRSDLAKVTHAMAANAGDTVVLGDAAGPRFQLQSDDAQHSARPGQAGFTSGIAHEVERRAEANLQASGPFREVYDQWYRFKTGAFFTPRNIVTLAGTVIVLLGGSFVGCTGLLSAAFLHHH